MRLSYANTLSTLALVVALGGGTAFAVAQIGAKDIAKDAVRGKHIKANAVAGAEIKDGAIGTSDLANNSATGAKVKESTLGVVPNATAWDGITVEQFNIEMDSPTPLSAQLLSDSGVTITAGCNSTANNEIDIDINTVGATFPLGVNAHLRRYDDADEEFVRQLEPNTGVGLTAIFGDWTFMVNRADASMMVLHFWTSFAFGRPPNECFIRGTRTNYPAP